MLPDQVIVPRSMRYLIRLVVNTSYNWQGGKTCKSGNKQSLNKANKQNTIFENKDYYIGRDILFVLSDKIKFDITFLLRCNTKKGKGKGKCIECKFS